MTMPHLSNCSHSPDGWCLSCVKALQEENWALMNEIEEHNELIAAAREVVTWGGTPNISRLRKALESKQ